MSDTSYPSTVEDTRKKLEKFPAGSLFKFVSRSSHLTKIGIVESAIIEKITDPAKGEHYVDYQLQVKFSCLYEINHISGETVQDFNSFSFTIWRIPTLFFLDGDKLVFFLLTPTESGIFAPASDVDLQKRLASAQAAAKADAKEVEVEAE